MQDLLAVKEEYATRPAAEETINDPTNPKHYWHYRMFSVPFFDFFHGWTFNRSMLTWSIDDDMNNRCTCDIGDVAEG